VDVEQWQSRQENRKYSDQMRHGLSLSDAVGDQRDYQSGHNGRAQSVSKQGADGADSVGAEGHLVILSRR
tara:strand:- start:7562 stop:7771 length:210 start_codon:yes stop_codon:yes gene_type:complete